MSESITEALSIEQQIAEKGIPIVQIDGVNCVSVADTATLLGISVSATHRKINNRQSKLETKEWAQRLGVTIESLKAELKEVSA